MSDSTNFELSPKALTKAAFNIIGPAYQAFITKLPSPNLTWTDKLLDTLPSPVNARILELGCGPGVPGTKYLAQRVSHVVANDFSQAQMDLARKELAECSNVSFVLGDMASLNFAEGERRFDAVVAMYSLQHLPREEQPEMLRLVRGWLREGGMLLCNFDADDEPAKVMEGWLGATVFYSGFGAEQSRQMVTDAGFEVIEADVVSTVDGKKTVPFMWVLARKK